MKKRVLALALAVLTFCGVWTFSSCGKPEDPSYTLAVSLDLTEEWNKFAGADTLAQGCVVVRKEFLESNPGAVAEFLKDYRASVGFITEKDNADAAGTMIADAGIFANAAVAKTALPKCNIVYLDEQRTRTAMNGYLTILHGIAPESIGGAVPGDGFYASVAGIQAEPTDKTVRVWTLNGTTGFGMAKLISDAADGKTAQKYDFNIRSDASEVLAALTSKTADIAALPTNAAANVWNKTNGQVQVLAVNTLGCLYLITKNGTVSDFSELRGKTVYVPAQNPTFIFRYLCEQNGLTVGKDVIIDSTSYAAAANLRDAVAAGTVDFAVLPEPMVTVALKTANQK